MNANINYDEIPDTSAVQEDLLAALSSQHVTVTELLIQENYLQKNRGNQ